MTHFGDAAIVGSRVRRYSSGYNCLEGVDTLFPVGRVDFAGEDVIGYSLADWL